MLCNSCNVLRIANEAPCPNCGALSPLLEASTANFWERASTTEETMGKPRPNIFANAAPHVHRRDVSRPQQLNFPDPGYPDNSQPWAQPSFETHNPASTQAQSTATQSIEQRQAWLPVPYQQMPPGVGQTTMSLQLIPDQAVQHLLPALPDVVHVPPIYTEPRPIIPKYQAISSLVSVFLVALLLCGGSIYYANTTGKLAFLHQLFTNARPPNIQANQSTLPDPPNKIDIGPAYTIIPSAATALRVDPKTNFVITPINAFSPGQPFYLAFSVISPTTDGRVYTKWYTNNQYFTTVQSKELIKAHSNESGSVSITFPQAAEGSVEIYWNDQLAQRLYFVVR